MAKRPRKTKPADQAERIQTLLTGTPAATAERAAKPERRRHFTPDEHIAWAEQTCYRDTKGVGWRPLRYAPWQREAIRTLFAVRPDGTLAYRTVMPCFPRRCDKTGITALYDLYRALAFDDQLIVIQGNSEDQGTDTVFKHIVDTVRNSPALAALERTGEVTVLTDVILFHATGSTIKVQPAKERSTYGQKISVYHNTELCKAADDALYQVGASSTGDSWCGLSIVDSNMGDRANPVARYVELAAQAREEARRAAAEGRAPNPAVGDASIGAVWVSFEGLDDVLRRGCGFGLAAGEDPVHPWLDADWIRGRYAQMTRAEFLRNHCNQPSGAGEVLWSDEQIDPLFLRAPAVVPRAALARIVAAAGRSERLGSVTVGVGLDRAGAFSKTPDRSVLAAVARCVVPALEGVPLPVYDERGEVVGHEVGDGSLYILLAAWEFLRQLRDPLQAKLLQIDAAWGIDGLALEAYQASDLGEWCQRQRFGDRTRVEHMTAQAKVQLVSFFHGLVITRRFLAPAAYAVLRAELTNYRESLAGSVASYGGPRKTVDLEMPNPLTGEPAGRRTTWIKDDYLEATFWAADAARAARPRGRARVLAKPAGL